MRDPLLLLFASLLVFALWIIGLDLWLLYHGGWQATISWNLYQLSRQEPLIPCLLGLVIGAVLGHLFWPQ